MKVKTTLTFAEDLVAAIDQQSPRFHTRSAFIEAAVRSYLAQLAMEKRDVRERTILDACADRLNSEAEDSTSYQAL